MAKLLFCGLNVIPCFVWRPSSLAQRSTHCKIANEMIKRVKQSLLGSPVFVQS